jgi:hypothetical protein
MVLIRPSSPPSAERVRSLGGVLGVSGSQNPPVFAMPDLWRREGALSQVSRLRERHLRFVRWTRLRLVSTVQKNDRLPCLPEERKEDMLLPGRMAPLRVSRR